MQRVKCITLKPLKTHFALNFKAGGEAFSRAANNNKNNSAKDPTVLHY